MAIVRVKSKAQITLPVAVRRELGVEEGDFLAVSVRRGEIVLTPQAILDLRPEVELSEEGWRQVRAAQEDFRAGRSRRYNSARELVEDLRRATGNE